MELSEFHNYSDRELLNLFAERRDEVAFEQLIRRHQEALLRLAKSRVATSDLAKDVIQEVFIQLSRKSEDLVDHPSLEAWLVRATILESKRAVRQEANRSKRQIEFVERMDQLSPRFPDSIISELKRVMPQLPERYRRAIELRYDQGFSFEEIGKRLKKSPGASQRLVSRAVAKLRGLVSKGTMELVVGGSLGPALLVYFSSGKSAQGGTATLSGKGCGGVTAGTSSGVAKSTLAWTLSFVTALVALLMGLLKTREVKRLLQAEERVTVSTANESERRLSSRSRPGLHHEWFTTTPFEDVLQAYLAGDFQQAATNSGVIELMRSEELEKLYVDILNRPEQGTPAELLRKSVRKVLLARFPEESGKFLTRQAIEAQRLEEAIEPCFKWASENPTEALEWYLERGSFHETMDRRLWLRDRNNWLRLEVRMANLPPAGLQFSETVDEQPRELSRFDFVLLASLFEGIATARF